MVGTNDGEAIVESCLDGTLACPSVLEEYESGRTGIVGNDVTFTGPWVRIPPPPLGKIEVAGQAASIVLFTGSFKRHYFIISVRSDMTSIELVARLSHLTARHGPISSGAPN